MLGIVAQLFLKAERHSNFPTSLCKRWAHTWEVEGPSKEVTSAIAFQVQENSTVCGK